MDFAARLMLSNFRPALCNVSIILNSPRIILSFVRVLLPIFAAASSSFGLIKLRYYLVTGRQYKAIQLETEKLKNDLNNNSLINYIDFIKRLKQIPNVNNTWDTLKESYNLARADKKIDRALVTQLRITLNLKGINVL